MIAEQPASITALDPIAPAVVRTVVDRDEVEALCLVLATGADAPFTADVDAFRTVLQRAEVVRPHVIVVERGGRIDASLLGRLEEHVLPAKIGYATIYRPQLRCLTVSFGGVAGSDADQALLAAELIGGLRAADVDALWIQHMPVGSPLHSALLRDAPRLSRQRLLPEAPHWVMEVTDSVEAMHAQLPKSMRDNLRRYSRKLARSFGDQLEIRRYDQAGDYDRVLADIETIAAASYQRGIGAGFAPDADAPLLRIGLERGWLRAWVLYLDGAPCAFEVGYVRGDSVVIGFKGFDPAFGRYHAGKVLQLHLLEELAADPAVATLDFGPGDAEYKRRLSTRGDTDAQVMIYSRNLRGATAHVGRTIVLAIDKLARRVVGDDRAAKIKRRWRDLRTPATAS